MPDTPIAGDGLQDPVKTATPTPGEEGARSDKDGITSSRAATIQDVMEIVNAAFGSRGKRIVKDIDEKLGTMTQTITESVVKSLAQVDQERKAQMVQEGEEKKREQEDLKLDPVVKDLKSKLDMQSKNLDQMKLELDATRRHAMDMELQRLESERESAIFSELTDLRVVHPKVMIPFFKSCVSRDENGAYIYKEGDVELPLREGVKSFFKGRPELVAAVGGIKGSGAGAAASSPTAVSAAQVDAAYTAFKANPTDEQAAATYMRLRDDRLRAQQKQP